MTPLVSKDLLDRLNTLEVFLSYHILGQAEVLREISSVLRRSLCNLRFPDRPIASMLFLGPTGVGKTESAKLFTQHLFGSPEKLVRIDMSEMMTSDSINVLRGQNTSDRGLLGLYVDKSERSGTLLFDELEKAHPLIMDVFLQILSAGRFTLATGETLDLTNYVIVATSNIGSRVLMESRSTDRETIIKRTMQAVGADMRPEIVRRFTLRAVFNKMDYQTLKAVGRLHVEKVLSLFNELGHDIRVDESLISHVQAEGYSEEYGAAYMEDTALGIIGSTVSECMLVNGGNPVLGTIVHDRRKNICSLETR